MPGISQESTWTYTLMCRDHEVLRFGYDPRHSSVTWRDVLNGRFAPPGTIDRSGRVTRPSLALWISGRGIPVGRPGARGVLANLGTPTPESAMLSMRGASLSDGYWFREDGSDATWSDVNYFERDFSPELGLALAGPSDSSEGAVRKLRSEGLLRHGSPDAALDGNLPKRWVIGPDGTRSLVKSGKPQNLFMEPVNELAASRVCDLVLEPRDYVRYSLVKSPTGIPAYLSACPCFVADGLEFVSAHDVMASVASDNTLSLYERYARECERHGLAGIRRDLAKMLVVDHLVANWDRHWGNFGILMDSETREWVRTAPLFDMGESLWCDRIAAGREPGPCRMPYQLPFARDLDSQLERYAEDLSWLDADALGRVPDVVAGALGTRQLAELPEGWLCAVRDEVARRCEDVRGPRPVPVLATGPIGSWSAATQ